MKILPLATADVPKAMALLQANNLPTEDIGQHTYLFAAWEGDELVGTAGVELYENYALLRSLCVDEKYRSTGAGNALKNEVEQYAKEKGVHSMYLLTTTADRYFLKKGYAVTDRKTVPEVLQQTTEFASVCPSTAVVMKKELNQ